MTTGINATVPDQSSSEFAPIEVIPTADYRARLEDIEERPNSFNPDEPQWLWRWRIDYPEYPDHPIWQYTSQKLGEFEDKSTGVIKKSQARKNLEALLDGPLTPGEELNFEQMFYGLEAILSIGIKANSQGEVRNKVFSVLPASIFIKTAPGLPHPPQSPAAPALIVPGGVAPANASQLRTRYENAQKLLKWDLNEIKETIGWIAASDEPFFKLTLEQKTKVVEYLEQELKKPENDPPFFTGDEGASSQADEAPEPAKAPASTKHHVA